MPPDMRCNNFNVRAISSLYGCKAAKLQTTTHARARSHTHTHTHTHTGAPRQSDSSVAQGPLNVSFCWVGALFNLNPTAGQFFFFVTNKTVAQLKGQLCPFVLSWFNPNIC